MTPDIQPHELAAMRQAADKAPFDVQKKLHALIDAYEDVEGLDGKLDSANERLEKLGNPLLKALKGLLPDPKAPTPEEPLSDDAWAEHLEETDPSERAAASLKELQRARASEAALLKRVEALEEGIGSAVDDLEPIVSG
jgi:hypothetical protein